MKKNIFAVCDLEVDYAHNFMEYLNQKRNIPFEIQAFTNVSHLLEFAKKQHIELLLISDKAMCEEVMELPVGKLMILSEGVHLPELDKYPSVYKYQSSDNVIREVMACYGDARTAPQPAPVLKKPMEIIGVYSPLGRVLKTSFALALGQIMAKEKTVLYLNLEEYAGFEELFQTEYDHNLSDILYYLRQGNASLIHKLSGMVQSLGNLDYIPPVLSPGDIRCTSYEEWDRLLKELSLNSTYEAVILDIGDGTEDTLALLDCCKKIYMPVLTDVMSKAKLAQFEKLARIWDYPQILTKIEKIKLPYHTGFRSGKEYAEQLMWSELGDFVRKLLRKDKNES